MDAGGRGSGDPAFGFVFEGQGLDEVAEGIAFVGVAVSGCFELEPEVV
jgi:hypothetical protein